MTAFVAASYNVLATAYIQPDRYPATPAPVLDPARRIPALVRHIETLDADLLCLQEVEPETFAAVGASLTRRGFAGEYGRKRAGRPEGVAVWYRRSRFALTLARVVPAEDDRADEDGTGHVTQILVLDQGGRRLGVINTHLTWDPPGTAAASRRGLSQARRFIAAQRRLAADCDAWIIAGDFNVTPQSDVVAAVREAGFRFAHAGLDGVCTCNAHGAARLVDYLFFSEGLRAEPMMPRPIDGRTVLPSDDEPSDHLALAARFAWPS